MVRTISRSISKINHTSGAGGSASTLPAEAKGCSSSLKSRCTTSFSTHSTKTVRMSQLNELLASSSTPMKAACNQMLFLSLLILMALMLAQVSLEKLRLPKMMVRINTPQPTQNDHCYDHACLVSAAGPSRLYADTLLTISSL
jgi:hypothetical protein